MRISPIQKYALRLLVFSGDISPNEVNWNHLDFLKAEQLLSPFGGSIQAVTDVKFPQAETVSLPDNSLNERTISRHHRRKNNLERE
jgi:hypothetical protein